MSDIKRYADHSEDIKESARSYTQSMMDGETPLEVEVFLRMPDRDAYQVSVLLGYGGPTIWVDIDSRFQTVTFHHSWGTYLGRDRQEWELWGDDEEWWLEFADKAAMAEGYPG